jgi:hypothetical protein
MHFPELKQRFEQNKALYPLLSPYLSKLDDYLQELISASPEPRDIAPPLVAERLSINEGLALALLMLADEVGLIEPRYFVYCTETENYLESYSSLDDVPEKVFCPFHGVAHNPQDYYVELTFQFTPKALSKKMQAVG